MSATQAACFVLQHSHRTHSQKHDHLPVRRDHHTSPQGPSAQTGLSTSADKEESIERVHEREATAVAAEQGSNDDDPEEESESEENDEDDDESEPTEYDEDSPQYFFQVRWAVCRA